MANQNKPVNALLIVDLQNDFLPGGALAVKNGDQVIPVVDQLLQQHFNVKIATKDWHPKDHGSFAPMHGKQPGEVINLEGIEQILWPIHCVQGSFGAEFAEGWDVKAVERIFYKGTEKNIDSYSAFFDNKHRRSTGLGDYLRSLNVTDVYIVGIATDYCVKYSALDACHLGFKTHVIEDACRGVELQPGDVRKALKEMEQAGAHLTSSQDVLKKLS